MKITKEQFNTYANFVVLEDTNTSNVFANWQFDENGNYYDPFGYNVEESFNIFELDVIMMSDDMNACFDLSEHINNDYVLNCYRVARAVYDKETINNNTKINLI